MKKTIVLLAILLCALSSMAQLPEPSVGNPMVAPQFKRMSSDSTWIGVILGRHPGTGDIKIGDTVRVENGALVIFRPADTNGIKVAMANSDSLGYLDFTYDYEGALTALAMRINTDGVGVDFLWPLTNAIWSRGSIVPRTSATYNLGDRFSGFFGPGVPFMWNNGYFDDSLYCREIVIYGGAQDGYILTSDASGYGTWRSPSSAITIDSTIFVTFHALDSAFTANLDSAVYVTFHALDSAIQANKFKWMAAGGSFRYDSLIVASGGGIIVTQSNETLYVANQFDANYIDSVASARQFKWESAGGSYRTDSMVVADGGGTTITQGNETLYVAVTYPNTFARDTLTPAGYQWYNNVDGITGADSQAFVDVRQSGLTVFAARAFVDGGTDATLTLGRVRASSLDYMLSSPTTVSAGAVTDGFTDLGSLINNTLAIGDKLIVIRRSVTGTPTSITVEIQFWKAK